MERRARFSQLDSKYYEASIPEESPTTPGRPAKTAGRNDSRAIDLDELYEWTRGRGPQRRGTAGSEPAESEWPRPDEDAKSEWPVVDVEERVPGYSERPQTPTTANYNPNFLHPPTPGQEDFYGPTAAPNGDGFGQTPLRRRSTKMTAVIDLEMSSRFGWWTPILLVITALVVTLTALYANGTVKNLMEDSFFTSSQSNPLLVLRLLTEACALLLAALVMVVVEDLQWALASRPQGVSLLHFIGLDAGTGVWGLVRLLATAEWKEKYSSLFRLIVICTIPLPGIVLMGDITLELIFFPQKEYPVAAGVGQFDSSFIDSVDDTALTALLIAMGSPSWSTKDTWTLDALGPSYGLCTVSTNDTSWSPCAESHILTGGILGISPQMDDLTTYPASTAYIVPNTRTLQLEYGEVHNIDALYDNGECYMIGTSHAAAYWCTNTGHDQELLFGSSYCPLELQFKGECFSNQEWTKPLQIASSLFIFKRYATVNYDRGNFSVLSLTNLSPPERQIVALDEYMTAISAVVPGFRPALSNHTAVENVTKGDNSALAIYAVTALPINDNQIARSMSLSAVRKAMSVPFNYFHSNYFHSESIFEITQPRSNLSDDMYTTLHLAISSHQVVAGKYSRWAFGTLCGILLALCLGAIVMTARICERRPQRCGYPTLDFAAVCAAKGGIPRGRPGSSGLHRSLTALGQKTGRFQVAKRIKGEKIMLG